MRLKHIHETPMPDDIFIGQSLHATADAIKKSPSKNPKSREIKDVSNLNLRGVLSGQSKDDMLQKDLKKIEKFILDMSAGYIPDNLRQPNLLYSLDFIINNKEEVIPIIEKIFGNTANKLIDYCVEHIHELEEEGKDFLKKEAAEESILSFIVWLRNKLDRLEKNRNKLDWIEEKEQKSKPIAYTAYSDVDVRAITRPELNAALKRILSKSKYDFYFHFIDKEFWSKVSWHLESPESSRYEIDNNAMGLLKAVVNKNKDLNKLKNGINVVIIGTTGDPYNEWMVLHQIGDMLGLNDEAFIVLLAGLVREKKIVILIKKDIKFPNTISVDQAIRLLNLYKDLGGSDLDVNLKPLLSLDRSIEIGRPLNGSGSVLYKDSKPPDISINISIIEYKKRYLKELAAKIAYRRNPAYIAAQQRTAEELIIDEKNPSLILDYIVSKLKEIIILRMFENKSFKNKKSQTEVDFSEIMAEYLFHGDKIRRNNDLINKIKYHLGNKMAESIELAYVHIEEMCNKLLQECVGKTLIRGALTPDGFDHRPRTIRTTVVDTGDWSRSYGKDLSHRSAPAPWEELIKHTW